MNEVVVGIIGYGTVGQGVVEILQKNADEIARRCNHQIKIAIVARKTKSENMPFITTTNPFDVVNHPDVQIVLELAGGIDLPRNWLKKALTNQKHIITANKALIANYGEELFEIAKENNLALNYEASVAGGIPIIKTIRESMTAEKIQSVAGIINGTCNYILSKMQQNQCDFKKALQEAKELGYAETDPSFDIDGIDTAHKITILASLAFGIPLQFNKANIEGISQIDLEDINNADNLGFIIKHLGIAKRHNNAIELSACPVLISKNSQLAKINGVTNAVQLDSDNLGKSLYSGAGAGKLPTASMVVADLIEVINQLNLEKHQRIAHLGYKNILNINNLPILPEEQLQTAFYLKIKFNQDQSINQILQTLEQKAISIDSFINQEKSLTLLTNQIKMIDIKKTINEIKKLSTINKITLLRVEKDL